MSPPFPPGLTGLYQGCSLLKPQLSLPSFYSYHLKEVHRNFPTGPESAQLDQTPPAVELLTYSAVKSELPERVQVKFKPHVAFANFFFLFLFLSSLSCDRCWMLWVVFQTVRVLNAETNILDTRVRYQFFLKVPFLCHQPGQLHIELSHIITILKPGHLKKWKWQILNK